MGIQNAAYTKAMLEKAERLAAMVPTFTTAREKRTGITYVIVPSSDSPERTGHVTNGLHCSCQGYDRRGYCSHALAVSLHDRRRSEERIAAAQDLRRRNGVCRQPGCILTATVQGGRCDSHALAILDVLGY